MQDNTKNFHWLSCVILTVLVRLVTEYSTWPFESREKDKMLAKDSGCFTFLLACVLHKPLVALKLCRHYLVPGEADLTVHMVSLLLMASVGLWTCHNKHLGERQAIWFIFPI